MQRRCQEGQIHPVSKLNAPKRETDGYTPLIILSLRMLAPLSISIGPTEMIGRKQSPTRSGLVPYHLALFHAVISEFFTSSASVFLV